MRELVQKYIALRDKKAELVKEMKEKVAKVDQILEAFEAKFMDHFNQTRTDSLGCDAGTVYKSTRTSATVADWDAALGYIQEHELWNLLERRVAKKAVEEFVAEHNDLPPGINWAAETTVNVRRA